MNGQLKNLEFIAKTLRHAHNPIKFVSIPIQANVEHYFIALLPISNCLWRFPSNTESLFANIIDNKLPLGSKQETELAFFQLRARTKSES